MIYAEKGNKVKRIAEADIQKYVEQGFKITNGAGTVIQDTVPTDLASLKLAYTQHVQQITALKQQLEDCNQQIAILDAELATAKKAATKKSATKADTE